MCQSINTLLANVNKHCNKSLWKHGGSVTDWLGRQTWNPEVAGSSPSLTTKLELFLGRP